MRAALVVVVLGAAAPLAAAEGHHVLVLRSEGSADASTRSKVDTQVLKLAKNVEGNVEAGDISYSDATTAAGCANPGDAACRDEVLATMGADELVVTTVNSAPGGTVKIDVKRIAKGNAPREATTTVPTGQPPDAKMNSDIGPMFGLVAPPPAAEPAKTAPPPPPATDKPAPTPPPAAGSSPPPTRTAQAGGDNVTAAPNGQVTPTPTNEGESSNRRLELAGLGVGGSMVLVGALFWAAASSTQSDINAAPTRSPKDFQNLQDLESRGDAEATVGNVMFIGGVAVAAVSAFFFIRDRRAHNAQTARLAPAVFDHGAGITLSFGGGP